VSGASDHNQIVRASEEHAAGQALSPSVGLGRSESRRRESFPHARKFRLATAALVWLAIAAIIVSVVILSGGSKATRSSAPWSDWQPEDSGSLGARDIANHIAPLYRISGTDQLAVVTVVNLANPNVAAANASGSSTGTGTTSGLQVAVRPDPSSSDVSLLSGNTIAYNLCGIGGSNCAIGVGTPSAARLLLLRREALELAMYTFKYIGGTENVVAILPPGRTNEVCTGNCSTSAKTTSKPIDVAVLFLRDELKPWLGQPLDDTLQEFPPTVPELPLWTQTEEASLVNQITAPGLFSEQLVQAQDGTNLILLNPLPPQ
jgi:hypothetical protein